MAYDTTFTLSYGVGPTTVTFHVRPELMNINLNIMSAEHSIPGATHSIIQMLGSSSEGYSFPFYLHDINLITKDNPAPTRPQDVLSILRTWARNGYTCVFTCDYVTQLLGEASGIDVKITNIRVTEVPAADGEGNTVADKVANYQCEITLRAYYSG